MKLLHTSDWHLGRLFHNVSLLEDQQFVLDQLLKLIDDHQIDGVIIAGDIYDRAVPPASAVTLLSQWMTSVVTERKIPVFMISGNHDSAERLGFASAQLQQAGLTIVSNLEDMLQPTIWRVGDEAVQIVGLPYLDPSLAKQHYPNKADGIKDFNDAHKVAVAELAGTIDDKLPSICVSHCFIDGANECESERPLSVGGADRVDYGIFSAFDYTALGHLHQQQNRGKKNVRYSGSPMKYSFSEQHHNKGVTIVTITDAKISEIKHQPVPALRDMRVIEGAFDDIIAGAEADAKSNDYILVRLTDNHAILDPMARLRAGYPNVLHIERPALMAEHHPDMDKDALKRDERDVFADFFLQVVGENLTEEQSAAFDTALSSAREEEK